jgi:hypothetical protein
MLEASEWRTVKAWTYMTVNGVPAVAYLIGLSIGYAVAYGSYTLILVHCKVSSQENACLVVCMYT